MSMSSLIAGRRTTGFVGCVWSEVSRSGFYEWRDRPDSGTTQRRAELAVLIKEIFEATRGTYGYRRVQRQLRWDGVQASPELVRSIMIAEDLVPCQPRPWRVRTQ